MRRCIDAQLPEALTPLVAGSSRWAIFRRVTNRVPMRTPVQPARQARGRANATSR